MLHAFNGKTGKEFFGFIPHSSLQHIGELANPEYAHQYYVDGPVTIADAHYVGNWHTVAVGTTGVGGAQKSASSNILPQGSIFALKVDTPASVSEDDLLWDLSGQHDADLGQVTGAPVVVAVKHSTGARFIALFGNGVDSGSGCPILYAVEIETGEVLAKLKPNDSSYCNRNGLINIRSAALHNNNGFADTVYGGDLQGHLWKFDLSSVDPADWGVAYAGEPLFSATDDDGKAQPITGGIRLAAGPGGGEMVYFGTGRYLTTSDTSDQSVQSLYGILDNMGGVITGNRDDVLAEQTLAASTSSSSGYESRTVSGSGVSYLVKKGWFIDLAVGDDKKGERFIGIPTLQGSTVYFVTYTPTQGTDCAGGGENWEYGVNSLTGGGALGGIADASGSTNAQQIAVR
jgi:type IV pilus assembly protein PilY1